VTVYSLGGIIQSIKVPNKDGELADVVLGYDTPQGVLQIYIFHLYLGVVSIISVFYKTEKTQLIASKDFTEFYIMQYTYNICRI